MNSAFLVGRLVSEPERRETQGGVVVTTFRMAVGRRFKKDESDFLTVVSWRGLAENCAKYLVKGQRVAVAGRVETRSFETKDGDKRYITEIQADDIEFLDRPNGATGFTAPTENEETEENIFSTPTEEEDLPF